MSIPDLEARLRRLRLADPPAPLELRPGGRARLRAGPWAAAAAVLLLAAGSARWLLDAFPRERGPALDALMASRARLAEALREGAP